MKPFIYCCILLTFLGILYLFINNNQSKIQESFRGASETDEIKIDDSKYLSNKDIDLILEPTDKSKCKQPTIQVNQDYKPKIGVCPPKKYKPNFNLKDFEAPPKYDLPILSDVKPLPTLPPSFVPQPTPALSFGEKRIQENKKRQEKEKQNQKVNPVDPGPSLNFHHIDETSSSSTNVHHSSSPKPSQKPTLAPTQKPETTPIHTSAPTFKPSDSIPEPATTPHPMNFSLNPTKSPKTTSYPSIQRPTSRPTLSPNPSLISKPTSRPTKRPISKTKPKPKNKVFELEKDIYPKDFLEKREKQCPSLDNYIPKSKLPNLSHFVPLHKFKQLEDKYQQLQTEQVTKKPNMDNYVLKSKVESTKPVHNHPNKHSTCPKCPDLSRYILKSKLESVQPKCGTDPCQSNYIAPQPTRKPRPRKCCPPPPPPRPTLPPIPQENENCCLCTSLLAQEETSEEETMFSETPEWIPYSEEIVPCISFSEEALKDETPHLESVEEASKRLNAEQKQEAIVSEERNSKSEYSPHKNKLIGIYGETEDELILGENQKSSKYQDSESEVYVNDSEMIQNEDILHSLSFHSQIGQKCNTLKESQKCSPIFHTVGEASLPKPMVDGSLFK